MESGQENSERNDVAEPANVGAGDATGGAGEGGSVGGGEPAIQIRRPNLTAGDALGSMNAPQWAISKGVCFGTFDATKNGDEEAIQSLRQAAAERQWIGIVGRSPGRGKTHLGLSSMLRSWHNDLYPPHKDEKWNRETKMDEVIWTQHSRSVHDYQFRRADVVLQKMSMAGIRYEDLHDELVRFRCLMLDEVGRNMTGTRADIFYSLTGELYDRGGQLIWTAPYSKAEVADGRLDGAFLDRAAQGLIIELPEGKSHRRIK